MDPIGFLLGCVILIAFMIGVADYAISLMSGNLQKKFRKLLKRLLKKHISGPIVRQLRRLRNYIWALMKQHKLISAIMISSIILIIMVLNLISRL